MNKRDNVYAAIKNNSPGGVCTLNRQELADELGYSKRAVIYHVDDLTDQGKLMKKGAAIHLVDDGREMMNGFEHEDDQLEVSMEDLKRYGLVKNKRAVKRSGILDLLDVDPRVWFLVLMLAQTVHTFKFIYFVSGADWWSLAYAIFTCIGMDFVTYTFVVKGERYRVESMKAFYILANVYAFNVGLFGDMVLDADLFWRVMPNGQFWISLIPSFFIPHMAVKFSEWVYKSK
jgi:biotin operon repressor